MAFWPRYLDGVPDYLARHYWWAYLAPRGVWFFDHHFIINLILFGQYRTLLRAVMRRYDTLPPGCTLQLTCAYGALTPTLATHPNTQELHLMDVAAIQLAAARRKIPPTACPVHYARINAEALAYADASFDTVLIFFLLHELPPAARRRALGEALRVLRPGGTLLIAEYAPIGTDGSTGVTRPGRACHLLHRFPFRQVLERLEPFLGSFWDGTREDSAGMDILDEIAQNPNITLFKKEITVIFRGFYRILEFRKGG